MWTEIQTADDDAGVTLPDSFADSTVIIEQLSDTEVRIYKASVAADADVTFPEEEPIPLSGAARDRFLTALEDPPEPNEALLKALSEYNKRHG